MKTIEVVAAIIKDPKTGAVFATQRGYGDYAGGWEFPGGKVEPGETPEQAIVREIHEELEAIIAVDGFLTTVDWDYPTFHLTMHCFWAHVDHGSLELLEHSAAKWLSLPDIDSVDWLPADLLVVDAIKAASTSGVAKASGASNRGTKEGSLSDPDEKIVRSYSETGASCNKTPGHNF